MNIHIKRLLVGLGFAAFATAGVIFLPEAVIGYGLLGIIGVSMAYLIGWGLTD